MDSLRFSIIIPCYNAADEVEKTIISVKNQTFKSYEIIAVDDCSKDNTYEILSNQKDVKVIRNSENLRAGGSRNVAMALAKGEYIIFLDADDYLADEKVLERLDGVIGNEEPDIVYLGFESVGRIEEKWIPTEENSNLSSRMRNWKYENVWDICWNTKFLKNNDMRFVKGRYFEDFVFYYKGILRANTYKVASFITHVYITSKSDSMTSSVDEVKLQDLYSNVIDFLEELKSIEDERKRKDVIFAINRVVEYSTRLLKQYEEKSK